MSTREAVPNLRPLQHRRVPTKAAVVFRDRLRAGRATALADAEGYLELLLAIEELGRFVANRADARGLGDYSAALAALASEASVEARGFPPLLDALREARNDAAHLGAAARRTTTQAIDVAVFLEDALANHAKLKLVEHYMVEGPICAEPWQTLSMVRKTMLRSQFSTLPYRRGKTWHVLTDATVVRFLSSERKHRLNLTIEEALELPKDPLALAVANVVSLGTLVDPLRSEESLPVFVLDDAHNLRGILTPFDLL